jgi:hydrogenase/urease accessory protein HupE
MRIHVALGLAFVAVVALPRDGEAHLMPAWQGSTHLVGNRAYTLLSIPVAALEGVDDNHDGRLAGAELGRHYAEIDRQLSDRVRLTSNGELGKTLYQSLVIEHSTETADTGMTSITLMRISEWKDTLTAITVMADVIPKGAPDQIMFRAILGDSSRHNERIEVADFAASRTSHEFFRGPWRTLGEFLGVGVGHILGGPDHLLFLLAVLVVGVGWRYWLGIVTAFTVAHSITLVAAAMGWVHVSPKIVEPAIAASIVIVAIDFLWRGARSASSSQRIGIVFCCGLLHGLGFASALAELGANGSNRWASLAGFNLGVEVGQGMFVLAFLVLSVGLRRAWVKGSERLPRYAAATAAAFGLLLFVQRLT